MTWPIREYPIVELNLDQENIRTPISQKDQNALIRDMFINEEALKIAKSYSQHNVFPDEFPIGILEENHIVLIEGNRRLAALKALREPDIVPTYRKQIVALKNPQILYINIVLAPSRDAAIKHIANKHTIDYRRPWKPLRKAYFYKSQIENGKTVRELIEEYPDHEILRSIKMLEMHHMAKSINYSDDEIERKVHDERKFPITNLERFYGDPAISKFMGINFDNEGHVIGKIIKSEFVKAYKKMVEDVAKGEIDSRQYNTAKEREKYVESFPAELKPDLSKKGKFGAFDFREIQAPIKKTSTKKSKGKPFPKGLFYQSEVPFKLPNTSLKIMYVELRDIDVKTFPNAAHDLLRSFLECLLVVHLKSTGEYSKIQKNKSHYPKLSELLTFTSSQKCTSISDNNLIQVIKDIKTNWAKDYSLTRMNMINHNENWVSTEKDVRGAWGKLESLIKFLVEGEK